MSDYEHEPLGMPKEVAAAVASVMANVAKLGKGEENKHGNYKFASIDDFLEMVRPLCVEAGLIVVQNEESMEVIDKWLKLSFSFTLVTKEGVTWNKPLNRSIMVQSQMGAQAFGAAQSYALKQFMRSLFQIATGDGEDADTHEQTRLPTKTKEAVTKELDRVKSPTKATYSLEDDAGGVTVHSSPDAFLTALGGLLKASDDPAALWNKNEAVWGRMYDEAASANNEKLLGRLKAAKDYANTRAAELNP